MSIVGGDRSQFSTLLPPHAQEGEAVSGLASYTTEGSGKEEELTAGLCCLALRLAAVAGAGV